MCDRSPGIADQPRTPGTRPCRPFDGRAGDWEQVTLVYHHHIPDTQRRKGWLISMPADSAQEVVQVPKALPWYNNASPALRETTSLTCPDVQVL